MGTCQSTPKKITPADQLLDVTQRTLPGLKGISSARNAEVEQDTAHPIFKAIEDLQAKSGAPFGRILDAGTGLGSLKWIAHLTSSGNQNKFGVSDWIAITASETMIKLCTGEGDRLGLSTKEHLLLGNWFGEGGGKGDEDDVPERITFPRGEEFDVILVDYVIGALDAFSPFRQDCIFDRLAAHLKPGGRMYLVGMQPIPETQSGEADLVCKVKRLRDSCILLAGERCYREHPISWVKRTMQKSCLRIIHTMEFPLLHREEDLMDQVGTARWMLRQFDDKNLASALEDTLDCLKRDIHANMRGRQVRLGFDYLVVAEKPPE